jgi:hypothetical protein
MPYKFNEGRRHKIPKARYRVTNWPQYDAALVRRGWLTVWQRRSGWQAQFRHASLGPDQMIRAERRGKLQGNRI